MTTDREAIATLLAEYCHLCDDGELDALVDRFTEDGVFAFGDRSLTGREQMLRWFSKTQSPERRGKHLTTNSIIEVDGDRATAVSDFVFFEKVDGRPVPFMAGTYVDELVRDGDRWRFRRRTVIEM
jgi:3-phenylpropionate/cinnamic acid dioxygenase small subunit